MSEKSPEQVKATPLTKTTNEVIESYLLATSKRNAGVYVERILLMLVKVAQVSIADKKISKDLVIEERVIEDLIHDYHDADTGITLKTFRSEDNELGLVNVVIPIKSLFLEGKQVEYTSVLRAFTELQRHTIQWESTSYNRKGELVKHWNSCQIIGKVTTSENKNGISGKVKISVDASIWKAILDFRKGFRAIDLNIALSLGSKYSLRIYELLSRQTTTLTYTINELIQMWQLSGSYSRVENLRSRILDTAVKELNEKGFAVSYKFNKSKESGKKYTSVTFFPPELKGEANEAQLLKKYKIPLRRETMEVLKEKFDFSQKEIENNSVLPLAEEKMLKSKLPLPDFLRKIAPRAIRIKNTKGYVINAVKMHLMEDYDVVFDD